MEERIARRRTTIFQKIQVELTHGTIIRERISPGKFPVSSVGIVKIIAVLLLVSAVVSFLAVEKCPKTPDWYTWLFTVANTSGAAVSVIFYAVFTLGFALKHPGFWFISDISSCLVLAIFIISVSIVTITQCESSKTIYKIPGPLGICGAVLLLITSAGLYIMYKHKESTENTIPKPPPVKGRKSIFGSVEV